MEKENKNDLIEKKMTLLKALCEAPEGSPAFLQRINSGAYRV